MANTSNPANTAEIGTLSFPAAFPVAVDGEAVAVDGVPGTDVVEVAMGLVAVVAGVVVAVVGTEGTLLAELGRG